MRYDWDRLPNTRDDCFELCEFPEALLFSWASRNSVTSISPNWAFDSAVTAESNAQFIWSVNT
jgi:hypothetical protein